MGYNSIFLKAAICSVLFREKEKLEQLLCEQFLQSFKVSKRCRNRLQGSCSNFTFPLVVFEWLEIWNCEKTNLFFFLFLYVKFNNKAVKRVENLRFSKEGIVLVKTSMHQKKEVNHSPPRDVFWINNDL